MKTDNHYAENIQKKFIELDKELNEFFQAAKEIRELRDSVGSLPDKLKRSEEELERQKQVITGLNTSSKNILMSFEEKAKGLFYDLEKKTDTLTGDVRASISGFRDMLEAGTCEMNREQMEKIERISGEYEQIKKFFDNIKSVLDSHEHSIMALRENYSEAIKSVANSELSVKEIQKTVSELKRRAYEPDSSIKSVEAQLKELFFSQLEKQRKVILIISAVLMACIIFTAFYLSK